MNNSGFTRPDVLTEDLQHDYCDLGLPSTEIGKRYNISPETVANRLRMIGISMRSASEAREGRRLSSESLAFRRANFIPNPPRKYRIKKKDLVRKYLDLRMTPQEIARHYGCTDTLIRLRLKECDISIRNISEATKGRKLSPKVLKRLRLSGCYARPKKYDIPKEDLEYKYCQLGMATTEICKDYGCTHIIIGNRLKEYGILLRSRKDAHNTERYIKKLSAINSKYAKELPENPVAGMIVSGQAFGRRGGNGFIWHRCPVCGKERWVGMGNLKNSITGGTCAHCVSGLEGRREKQRQANLKRYQDPKERKKTGEASKKSWVDNPRNNIKTKDLCHDYCKLKMSPPKIATKYGISASMVHKRLRKARVRMRTLEEAKNLALILPLKDLRYDYCKLKMPMIEIAKKYGVSGTAIANRLHTMGAPMRSGGSPKGRYLRADVYTKDLQYDYCVLNMTTIEIGEKYGISSSMVSRRLVSAGIPMRTQGEGRKGRYRRTDIHGEDLQYDYCELRMSSDDIGKKYGIGGGSVILRLRAMGVRMRSVSESAMLYISSDKLEQIRYAYCVQKRSCRDIAKEYSVGEHVIADRLRKMDIKLRTGGETQKGWLGRPDVQTKDLQHDYCILHMGCKAIGAKYGISSSTVLYRLRGMGIKIRKSSETRNLQWAKLTAQEQGEIVRHRRGAGLKPTKPEILMRELLENLYPRQWKYVGNGDVVLGRRNPDFVNVNGQKAIVEVFGDYWHSRQVTGKWKYLHCRETKRDYAKYGYKTLIVWESELKDMGVVTSKIQQFCDKLEVIH